MTGRSWAAGSGVLLSLLLPRGPARADPSHLEIPRVSFAPSLESFARSPSEAAAMGAAVSDFRQREPGDGTPSSLETNAWVCYDENNLYVLFACADQPDKVRAHLTKREASRRMIAWSSAWTPTGTAGAPTSSPATRSGSSWTASSPKARTRTTASTPSGIPKAGSRAAATWCGWRSPSGACASPRHRRRAGASPWGESSRTTTRNPTGPGSRSGSWASCLSSPRPTAWRGSRRGETCSSSPTGSLPAPDSWSRNRTCRASASRRRCAAAWTRSSSCETPTPSISRSIPTSVRSSRTSRR